MVSFRSVHQKLMNIEQASSTTEKRTLLKSYLACGAFATVVTMACHENMRFGVSELPHSVETEPKPIEDIFKLLNKLSKKAGTTNAQAQELADTCSNDPAHVDVVNRIVSKDLGCGVGKRTVFSIVPDLFFVTPYQRCSTIKEGKGPDFPAFEQVKKDGMFAYTLANIESDLGEGKKILTRRGKWIEIPHISDQANKLTGGKEKALLGELECIDLSTNKPFPRKISNGYINTLIQGGTLEPEIFDNIRYTVWDAIDMPEFLGHRAESLKEYDARFNELKAYFYSEGYEDIHLIGTTIVSNMQEAEDGFKTYRRKGEEGTIIKNFKGKWKNNTANWMFKMKRFLEFELEIVEAIEGKGRLKGKMGKLVCKSSDGGIVSGVGTGFSDDERDLKYWASNIGEIVTAKVGDVITRKGSETMSFDIAVFVETRFNEKDTADSTEHIVAKCKEGVCDE